MSVDHRDINIKKMKKYTHYQTVLTFFRVLSNKRSQNYNKKKKTIPGDIDSERHLSFISFVPDKFVPFLFLFNYMAC